MDPVLEEFCRAHELQTSAFRRMQRYFRDELGPKLDRLETENAELKAHIAAVEPLETAVQTHVFGEVAAPVKRKRGRPRKYPVVEDSVSV